LLDLWANFKPQSPARRAAGWALRQPKEQASAYASACSLYILHLLSDFFTPTIDKEPYIIQQTLYKRKSF